MKKLYLVLIYLFASINILFAQGWTELGTGTHALNANNAIVSICADSNYIYAAGGFTDSLTDTSGNFYVAKWNGTSWSQVGSGSNSLHANGSIGAMCFDTIHNLYAAGGFTDINGKFYVAKWNGITWNELGTGSNALNANGPISSICIDHAGNVYAAGQFTDSLSDTAGHFYVAKWDGTTWSELGTGSNALTPNGYINSIAVDASGNLYAAGEFYIGGYNYVAKWDGTSWRELGTGGNALNANGSIWVIHADTVGNIYAGGFFRDAMSKYYVAKWDGTTWTELGTGSNALNANDAIFSISSDLHGNIYAGGAFADINGNQYVAKWNGTMWSEIGTGTNSLKANGTIDAICTDDALHIYAAGDFTDSIPGYGSAYVAMYSGASQVPVLNESRNLINAYPNPSRSIIEILINTSELMSAKYMIYDLLGKQILSGKIVGTNTPVDISNLQAGIYLLRLDNISSNTIELIKE